MRFLERISRGDELVKEIRVNGFCILLSAQRIFSFSRFIALQLTHITDSFLCLIECFIGDRRLNSTNVETLDALAKLPVEGILELSAKLPEGVPLAKKSADGISLRLAKLEKARCRNSLNSIRVGRRKSSGLRESHVNYPTGKCIPL